MNQDTKNLFLILARAYPQVSNRTMNAAHEQAGREAFYRQQMKRCGDCDGTGYRTIIFDGELSEVNCRKCDGKGYLYK